MPLDIVYAGWAEQFAEKVEVCEWVDGMMDRMSAHITRLCDGHRVERDSH